VYNEEDSIPTLVDEIFSVRELNNEGLEIVFIDDGSTDKTKEKLIEAGKKYPSIKNIFFVKNFGQTAAITAGIDNAEGDVLITMDSDLQNDPNDIPKLLKKLDKGYDVVCGWRKNRKDKFLNRRLPSRIANMIISKISHVHLNDYGCTLKAFKKNILKDIRLYGEMHRFIPIYISWNGGKIAEEVVNHRHRKHGKSKYGISRTVSVIVDLIFLKFLEKQFSHPSHLFGGFSLINFSLSIISFLLMLYFKFFGEKSFIETPLPQLVILFILIGVISLFMGFIAEILMRTYYESQNRKSYVKKK
jgi:glycosyltransferase involved in cell wall biosynthesis